MRRLVALASVVGMVLVLAVPAQAAQPLRITFDNLYEDELCDGTVDLIETGWVMYHEHTNGEISENNTYHLDVTYKDGDKELFFKDTGVRQYIVTENGLILRGAGQISFVNADGFAHIGTVSSVITWVPFSDEIVHIAGQPVDICGYFD